MTPEETLDKKVAIYRWATLNLKPGMHVKFAGSRSNGRRGNYRVVDRVFAQSYPASAPFAPYKYIRSPTTNSIGIVSHNQSETVSRTGEVRINETDIYATNDASKLSQVRINGVWTPIRKLIYPKTPKETEIV